MTEYYSGPTTPLDVARYGHVASRLREEMDKRNWTVAQLNREMGHHPSNSGPYAWLKAKSAPSKVAAKKLAKIFGCSWTDLQGRKVIEGEAREVQLPARITNVKGSRMGPAGGPPQPSRMFNFAISDTFEARIQLDVTLPVAEAWLLLEALKERGLAKPSPAPTGPVAVPDADDEAA